MRAQRRVARARAPTHPHKLLKLHFAAAVVVKDGDYSLRERVVRDVGDLHELLCVDAARVVLVQLLEPDVHALNFFFAHVHLLGQALHGRRLGGTHDVVVACPVTGGARRGLRGACSGRPA